MGLDKLDKMEPKKKRKKIRVKMREQDPLERARNFDEVHMDTPRMMQ